VCFGFANTHIYILVLNKLAPEKFDILVERALAIKISSLDTLKSFTNILYCKAVEEYKFAALYARVINYASL
jgi:hypothetical protein